MIIKNNLGGKIFYSLHFFRKKNITMAKALDLTAFEKKKYVTTVTQKINFNITE